MAAERTTVDGGVMYKNNRKEEGLKILDQVIILLAAEAKVLGE